MSQPIKHQSGFTAVELLITLFVAAAFLVAGYQLFSVVLKDGGVARAESRASSIAYDYLRRYVPSATKPCSTIDPLTNAPIAVDGIANVQVTVTIRCTTTTVTDLSKVEVVVTYNTPTQTVRYATYASGSNAPVLDVTNGLVGWWKLNGNTVDSSGFGNNGQLYNNPTPTTQDGVANMAYAFNGSSQYIGFPGPPAGVGITNVTITCWMYTASTNNRGTCLKVGSSGTGYGIGMGNNDFDNAGANFVMIYENRRWITTGKTLSVGWHQLVMVIDASGVPYAYADGVLVGSYPGSGPIAPTGANWVGATEGIRFYNGSIGEARVYNRALSSTEIATLYAGGAK